MLLGTLGASLLGYILAGKGINRAGKGHGVNKAGKGQGINRAGEGVARAGYGRRSSKKMDFYAASSFKQYYQNKPRFNGVYYRDNLPKIDLCNTC